MNMTRILRHLYIIILLASTLSSCREEGVDHEVDMTCTDIVTFAGNIDGRATFTFNKVDDSPEITLRAQGCSSTTSLKTTRHTTQGIYICEGALLSLVPI
jgi:hypothetical protein